MKKLISILLSVMLVVSGLSLSTFAADEAYRYDFDTGFLAGNGGASSGTENSITTGLEGLELFTDAADIYIKGWCYTVSGVAELWYELNGVWTQMPEDGFSDRSDVYGAITQEFAALGIPADTNTKSGFDYRIPLEGITLKLGMQAFKVKVVTNDGVEILLADVEFNYCEPYISTVPKKAMARGNNTLQIDNNRTYRDGSVTATTNDSSVRYAIGAADAVGTHGWFSVDVEIEAFGYSFNDDNNIVYDETFASEPEDAVVEAGQYDYDMRYTIVVPTADLALGTYKVKMYCKLVNGEQIIINELTVVVAERTEIVPNDILSSVVDAMSSWNLSESANFVDGADLTQGSGAFPGSTFRAVWSPRVVATGTITVKTDAATSNNYVSFNQFTSYYHDNRWYGGYTFSVDLAINEVNRHGRGMFLNFSDENAGDSGKLYEAWCDIDNDNDGIADYVVTGDTGILVWPYDATTLKIAVLTYEIVDGTVTKGAVVADIDLAASGVDFTTLTKVTAVDNDEGAIFVLVADKLVAKITYADATAYDEGKYNEGYYKASQVIGADGTVLAETDKAIISKYKTAGLGTRANTLYADNLSLTEAIEVEDTTVEVVPTDIELKADSIYTIDTTNMIITAKATSFSGINYDALMANFAHPKYIQVVTSAGAVTTTVSRLSSKYTINLIDGDGNVVKTYKVAVCGDITGDGRINGTDLTRLKSKLSGYTAGTVEFYTANINGDRRINSTDAAVFKSALAVGTFA